MVRFMNFPDPSQKTINIQTALEVWILFLMQTSIHPNIFPIRELSLFQYAAAEISENQW